MRGELPRLAKKYGLTVTGVHDIITGKSFKHLGDLLRGTAPSTEPVDAGITHGSKHSNAKLTEQDVRKMRALRSQGTSVPQLAEQFGLKVPQTAAIVAGRAWRHV